GGVEERDVSQRVAANRDDVGVFAFADCPVILLDLHRGSGPVGGRADRQHRIDSQDVHPRVKLAPRRRAVKLHRDAAVSADQLHDAGFAQLVKLLRQRGPADRVELEIREAVGVFDRFSDVGDDLGRQTFAPGRVVELFGVVAQIFIIEQTFDRGRPEERAEGHIRRALADHRDDVGRVFGRRRQAGVLEAIDSGLQPAANLFGTVRMRDHREPVFVRFVDHGADFIHRHLILVDQLYDIDSGIGQLADFGPRVVNAFDPPAEIFRSGIRLVLNERAGDVERRAGNFTGVDGVADFDAFFQRPAQIARAGHAGQQQLFGRSRHYDRAELRRIGFVPMRVIAVAVDHQVDVHVPEARQHSHSFGRNQLGVAGNGQGPAGAWGFDAFAFNDDDA